VSAHDPPDVGSQARNLICTIKEGVYFLALPYISYGTLPPVVNELRRALHPTRSLFQHYYRRESVKAIEGRDGEQICKKVRGAAGKDQAILVEYLWVLRLDEGVLFPTLLSQR